MSEDNATLTIYPEVQNYLESYLVAAELREGHRSEFWEWKLWEEQPLRLRNDRHWRRARQALVVLVTPQEVGPL